MNRSLSKLRIAQKTTQPSMVYPLVKRKSCACLEQLASAHFQKRCEVEEYEHDEHDSFPVHLEKCKTTLSLALPGSAISGVASNGTEGYGQFVEMDMDMELYHSNTDCRDLASKGWAVRPLAFGPSSLAG
uniref:Uncharacterized protein n=1 Tax=Pseudictyota dubia TaxID=2749911 RepID=A0A7R9ZB35_9STRA|eukprot:CAMPEP_0197445654 /NCGR_PEP_ID=MMETSP1175-20131217/10819_1 /TAXON_ID=1003142 /ORGANISM="Triceratium dubium, Strain CCMP147" /LENGTH=129 /DNA_ID=CAMNT_0042976647 /DNA_START=410 /DNA_END=799 /DNA_ORIENTATION=+